MARIDANPGKALIFAGTLNDKSWLNPTAELWCSSAQPWMLPIPGAERFARGYGS